MTVEVRMARSRSELEDVFSLRHQVFAIEEQRLPPRSNGWIADRFDSFSESVSAVAYVDGVPAGSIRVTLDGPLGSPLDGHYDLTALRARCQSVDGSPELTAVVTSLCVRRDMRQIQHVTSGLLEAAVDAMTRMGAVHVIAVINPMIGALMQRVGLTPVGAPRFCPRVRQHLLSMHAPLSSLSVPRLSEPGLAGSIRYLADGETLTSQWAVVLAGKLRLPGGRLAGPGAVIDGGRAETPATVRVLSADAVQRVVGSDPEAMLARMDAIRPAQGDLFNNLLRSRVLGALDALGVLPLLDGSRTIAMLASECALDADLLQAMLTYLASEGTVLRSEGWALLEPERVSGELAFLQWLMGGYGPLLTELEGLVAGTHRYGEDVHRDDGQMAAASAAIGRQFTDAALLGVLQSPGIRRIADIGCGGAARLVSLCRQLPELTAVGIDLSSDCCRQAQDNIDAAGLSQRVEIIEARAEHWLAEQGSVDLVLSVGMFHDLLNSPGAAESFLAGVHAGLGEGGLLVIQDQLSPTTAGAGSWGPGFALVHRLMGQELFSEATYLSVLRAAGFRLLRRVPTDIPDNWIFLLQAE